MQRMISTERVDPTSRTTAYELTLLLSGCLRRSCISLFHGERWRSTFGYREQIIRSCPRDVATASLQAPRIILFAVDLFTPLEETEDSQIYRQHRRRWHLDSLKPAWPFSALKSSYNLSPHSTHTPKRAYGGETPESSTCPNLRMLISDLQFRYDMIILNSTNTSNSLYSLNACFSNRFMNEKGRTAWQRLTPRLSSTRLTPTTLAYLEGINRRHGVLHAEDYIEQNYSKEKTLSSSHSRMLRRSSTVSIPAP